MNINRKTKFNIGDTVYTPDIFDGEYYPNGPYKVKSIYLDVFEEVILVKYRVENLYSDLWEHHCFNSLEECKEWCLEKN